MRLHCVALLCAASVCAFGQAAKGIQGDILSNFDDTQKKIISLAEAVPAEKYTWRPAEGVRSISEVYMHIAGANYMIPAGLGVKPPAGLTRDMEKTVTDKAKVIDHLKKSFEHARKVLEGTEDLNKPTKLFGRDNTYGGVELLIVTHLHEHLGQSIAYARMNKVTPPWSGGN
jgi:uncharacterized damage-inducible protein DinB